MTSEVEKGSQRHQVFPVNGGEDELSYKHNSYILKKGVDAFGVFIKEGILEKLDIDQAITSPTSPQAFNIVDMGCAVGANTLTAVQNVVDSVNLKLRSQGLDHHSKTLEFQVFFNDLISSDFNTVFRSIPSDKSYYAAGVPGSFYSRLFPKSSLHFVYCGYSLHWLSKVPEGVADESSPAYNKGKIYWTTSPKEVAEAYKAQFERDIDAFLTARSLEVVPHGLIAFSILEALIRRNPNFTLERMEPLIRPREYLLNPDFPHQIVKHYRAVLEGLFSDHFGTEIINILFDRFEKKFKESSVFLDLSYKQTIESFVLLKRKSY
ncbi:hypothetical protein TIFTF001_001977 [Ficus carica]|uniref:Uncharacterized protein n=1 Tax=Ficus carica TaxID=3494 RepID=A0AA87Z1Y0_FICCA|nr:hypothetical protein TIFTF001_001977 [Ficus carica]